MFIISLLLCAVVFGKSPWSTDNNAFLYNGKKTVLKGFSCTCLEYMVRGLGFPCFADYNWDEPASIISNPDMEVINALISYLEPIKDTRGQTNVMPFIRIPVTASSYLGDVTSGSADNFNKYPNLGAQYAELVTKMVTEFTSHDIITIIDLHWNNDDNGQEAMATKSSVGDSTKFWSAVVEEHKDNDLVFFELYNEPYVGDFNAWAYGNSQYTGMLEMYSTIRNAGADNMVVIAGGAGYAYDLDTLLSLNNLSEFGSAYNVAFNFHPYMGEPQAGDSRKNADGFESFVSQIILQTDRPIIVTEFGQACCSPDGSCYAYNGYYDGRSMGYVEAIINVCEKHGVSFCWWSWRPQSGPDNRDDGCMDCNYGTKLQDWDATSHSQGANFLQLYNKYLVSSSTPNSKPTPKPTPGSGPSPGNCADAWEQCGGQSWSGPTCCKANCSCNVINQWYSQCVPPSGNSCSGSLEDNEPFTRVKDARHEQ